LISLSTRRIVFGEIFVMSALFEMKRRMIQILFSTAPLSLMVHGRVI
jgi:hypothetical protein